jgi:hypothetical protein
MRAVDHTSWLAVGALCAAAAACDFDPDLGPVQAGSCDPADSDPDNDVSFVRDIVPILTRPDEEAGCSCHSPASSFRVGVDLGGLDISSHGTLLRGGQISGRDIIVPGDPCASILVQKVSSAPPFGSRMPLFGPPFLTGAEQSLIADWIAEGAENN